MNGNPASSQHPQPFLSPRAPGDRLEVVNTAKTMCKHPVCIVTHSFMQKDGNGLQIGGVETYVGALCELLAADGARVDVVQPSIRPFRESLGPNVNVIGVGGDADTLKMAYQSDYRGKYALTVFAYFNWADWNRGEKCVAIQHGVASDGFWTRHRGVRAIAHRYLRAYEHWRERRATARILDSVAHVICVDLNFPNWLRATFPFRRWEEKLTYVPNFGDPIREDQLQAKLSRQDGVLRVLTARRFEAFRGALLLGRVVRDIAADFPEVQFQFAGTGSEESQLRALLAGVPHCEVLEIPYREMPRACLESDIAVIPTLWSEGTSLACIEAMCAGSAVLATNIGGLSNLILNNFNGLIVEPTYESLRSGLLRLLGDRELRRKLGHNAYVTARECFSRARWREQVREVLRKQLC